jgi:hypothetical protein
MAAPPHLSPARRAVTTSKPRESFTRAGCGVAVRLDIYAHCIDRQAVAANKRSTAPCAQDAEQDPATKVTPIASRQPEVAGQRQGAGQDGQHTAPTLAVRARPCAARSPDPGAYGRIADGGSPESRPERRTRWSAAGDSDRSDGL